MSCSYWSNSLSCDQVTAILILFIMFTLAAFAALAIIIRK